MNKPLLKKIGLALVYGVAAGIPAGLLAYYTGISFIAPMGAAAGAAYGWMRGAE